MTTSATTVPIAKAMGNSAHLPIRSQLIATHRYEKRKCTAQVVGGTISVQRVTRSRCAPFSQRFTAPSPGTGRWSDR